MAGGFCFRDIVISSAHNHKQSVRSKLCKHSYRVSCFIQVWKLAWTSSWSWPMARGSCFGDPVWAVNAIVCEVCAASFASTCYHFSWIKQLWKLAWMFSWTWPIARGFCFWDIVSSSAHNHTQNVRSELCKHRYSVSCLIQLWKLAWTLSWSWPMAGGSCFGDPVWAVNTIVCEACAASLVSNVTIFPG